MSKLSWTPVKQGLIYCSPACGHGCKIIEYDRAELRAANLAKKIGVGWTTHVFENLGWHYSVKSPDGMMRIAGENYGKQHYFVEFGNSITGQIFTVSASSLEQALTQVKSKAKEVLHTYETLVNAIKTIL